MEINFKKKEKDFVEIECIDMDIAVLNSIKEILLRDKDVEFAAVKRSHPLENKHSLIVRTKKKDSIKLIKKAIKEFQSDLEKVEKLLKK